MYENEWQRFLNISKVTYFLSGFREAIKIYLSVGNREPSRYQLVGVSRLAIALGLIEDSPTLLRPPPLLPYDKYMNLLSPGDIEKTVPMTKRNPSTAPKRPVIPTTMEASNVKCYYCCIHTRTFSMFCVSKQAMKCNDSL